MITPSPAIQQAKTATQATFLVCGLALSSWAPMVPLVKERLGLNDADLGLLLLLLGLGAIVMMPISGILSHRHGTRIVILISGLTAAIALPLLLLTPQVWSTAIVLLVFGAAIGSIDVAMNSQGVAVEHGFGKPIMSSLHGLFSVGGLFGSIGLGFLIKLGLSALVAAVVIALTLIVLLIVKFNQLLDKAGEAQYLGAKEKSPGTVRANRFSWLSGAVFFLGAACFAIFLSEGAMLDWSALFLIENKAIDPELAGIGYAAFSVTMAVMRLLGDKLVASFSGRTVVIAGGLIGAGGIILAVLSPYLVLTLLGFALLGVGAANIVPVFFSEASRIPNVPAAVAIPAVTTIGYAGQLAGPALLGFIAYRFSLSHALLFTALLVFLVAVSYTFKRSS